VFKLLLLLLPSFQNFTNSTKREGWEVIQHLSCFVFYSHAFILCNILSILFFFIWFSSQKNTTIGVLIYIAFNTLQLKKERTWCLVFKSFQIMDWYVSFIPIFNLSFSWSFWCFQWKKKIQECYFCVITICLERHCSQTNWKEIFDWGLGLLHSFFIHGIH